MSERDLLLAIKRQINMQSSDKRYVSNLPQILENDGKYCYSFIPARVVFIILGFFGFNLIYAYKVVLSVAIVSMVGNSNNESDSGKDCKSDSNTSAIVNGTTGNRGDFDWDSNQQALLLGAFFYGYVITQIPGGLLAEKFGAKWIFGGSIFITAILSLVGPIAAKWHYIAFFATRVGQGLAEGVVFPCINAMFARWLPKMERSLGSTVVFTGSQIGTVITLPLAGYLCDSTFLGGWPAIFYILGISGCIWFALWALLIHETPDEHPHISWKELDYIKKGQGQEQVSQRPQIPWTQMLKSWPLWALVITHFGNNWGYFTILTLLPTYLQQILLLDIKTNGLMSSLPWLLSAIMSWFAGFVSDKVRSSERISISVIRKVCNSIGFMGPALCLIAVALSRCDTTKSIIFFSMAMGANGFTYSGFLCTHVDMAPDFAGILMGITNSIGSVPGFVAPLVANLFTKDNETLKSWSYVFYLSAVVYTGASLIFIFFGSAELQSWGISRKIKFSNNSDRSKSNKDSSNVYAVSKNNPQNDLIDPYHNNRGFVGD